jgi:tetratricopeptide (TPR) repeat protein
MGLVTRVNGFIMAAMGLVEPLERAAELAKLSALLISARDGRGQVGVIEGPSGVGKSFLLDACADSAAELGMSVIRARCSELTREHPFGVARSLFEGALIRTEATAHTELLRGPARLAEPLFGETHAPDEFGVVYGLYWLTVNLAERRPLAILIDDVHWADDFTLRSLAYIAERVDDVGVAIVVAIRSGDPHSESELIGHLWQASSTPPLRPAELSDSAITQLLAARLPGHDVGADLVQSVSRETGGNPLFVVTAAEAIRAGEDIAISTSESLRHYVVRRLGRLSSAARALARASSVLGDGVALGDAMRLARLGSDDGAVAAEQLVEANIWTAVDPIMFAHRIIRMAIYRVMGPNERLTLHSHAAKLLAARGSVPEEVAEHLLKSGPVDEDWALTALHDAGRSAARKGAPTAAIRYLRRAVDTVDPDNVPPRLLIDLGLAEAAAGEPTLLSRFERALALMSAPRERAEALYSLGQTLHTLGRYSEAAAAFRRGEALFEGGDPQVRLCFEGAAISSEYFLTTPAQRVELYAPEKTESGDGPGTRMVLAVQALQEAVFVPPARWGGDLAMRALAGGALLAEQTSQGPSINMAVLALLYGGRLSEALEAADATVRDARERGALLAHVEASYVRSQVLFAHGRITEAAADAQAAVDGMNWRWHGHPHRAVGALLDCLVERGELDKAAALIERADRELPAATSRGISALFLRARTRVHIQRGDFDAARCDLEEAASAVADYGPINPVAFPWRSFAGVVAHASGDLDRARVLIGEEIEMARLFEVPIGLGFALRCRARTEHADE